MYAKIDTANNVLKFPYTYGDLLEENPRTNYDARYSLEEWYSKTEDAFNKGGRKVIVDCLDTPEINHATQIVSGRNDPSLINEVWVSDWQVNDRTLEEIEAYQNTPSPVIT